MSPVSDVAIVVAAAAILLVISIAAEFLGRK